MKESIKKFIDREIEHFDVVTDLKEYLDLSIEVRKSYNYVGIYYCK